MSRLSLIVTAFAVCFLFVHSTSSYSLSMMVKNANPETNQFDTAGCASVAPCNVDWTQITATAYYQNVTTAQTPILLIRLNVQGCCSIYYSLMFQFNYPSPGSLYYWGAGNVQTPCTPYNGYFQCDDKPNIWNVFVNTSP